MKLKRYIPFLILSILFVISLVMLFNREDYKHDNILTNIAKPGKVSLSMEEVDLTEPPQAPEKITIQEGVNKNTLSWEAVEDVFTYEIKINDQQVISVNDNTYVHDSIKPGVEYAYTIRSIDNYGIGKWSKAVSGIPRKPDTIVLSEKIEMDGLVNDWNDVEPLLIDENGLRAITIVYDEKNMYLMVQGNQVVQGNCFYIDRDSDEHTGYTQTGWKTTGVEFMLCDSTLYSYSGTGMDWSWDIVEDIHYFLGNNIAEFTIPLKSMGITNVGNVRMSYSLGEDFHLPDKNNEMIFVSQEIRYDLSAIKAPALAITEVSSAKITLTFDTVEKAEGYEVDVDGQIMDLGQETFYQHTGLEAGSIHKYRVRAKSKERNSLWSKKWVVQTKSMTKVPGKIHVDGKVSDWTYLYEELGKATLPQGIYTAWSDNALGLLIVYQNIGNEGIILIDSGNVDNSGYQVLPWRNAKADYLIDGETISKYIGNGTDWKWVTVGEVNRIQSKDIIEAKIDISVFDFNQPKEIALGFMRDDINALPLEGQDMIPGYKTLTDTAQKLHPPNDLRFHSNARSMELIWTPVYGATHYEIEADGKIIGLSQESEYMHLDLLPDTHYTYRIRAINDDVKSIWSQPVDDKTLADHVKIHVDGKQDDWNTLMLTSLSQENNLKLYAIKDKKGLYFLIEGEALSEESSIYIDVDGSSRGYKVLEWYNSGADYLVYKTYLDKYTGNGQDWSWENIGEADIVHNGNIIEGYLDLELLGSDYTNELKVGVIYNDGVYIPSALEGMASPSYIQKVFQDLVVPKNVVVQPTLDSFEISWNDADGAASYEIEKNNSIINLETNHYSDKDVESGKEYTYRIRCKNPYTTSGWSDEITKHLLASQPTIKLDGVITDWNGIVPAAKNENFSLYTFIDQYYLNILIEAKEAIDENYVYIDVDNDSNSGYRGTYWTNSGADYVVIDGFLHKYTGDGDSWAFDYVREITAVKKGHVYEIKLPMGYIGMKSTDIVKLGYSDNVSKSVPTEGYEMISISKWKE